MHYVYILLSKRDNKLYIGSSNDLNKRLKEHNESKVFTTASRRQLELIYYEAYKIERDARIREKRLKHFGKAYQELKKRLTINPAFPCKCGVKGAGFTR